MGPMFTGSFQGLGNSSLGSNPFGSEMIPGLDSDLNSNQGMLSGVLQGQGLGSLGSLGQQSPMMKGTTSVERKHNLELLDTSYQNILTKQD